MFLVIEAAAVIIGVWFFSNAIRKDSTVKNGSILSFWKRALGMSK